MLPFKAVSELFQTLIDNRVNFSGRLLLLGMQKGIFVLLLLCMFSCTIEKRLYRPGYSIDWKHRKETVKNEADALRLKEENTPTYVSEKTDVKPEKTIDSYPLADTVLKPEIKPTERITSSTERNTVLHQPKQRLFRQNTGINNDHYDDHEEERAARSPNVFMQVLAVFLGIICGIIASVFAILLIFLAGDFSAFDSNGNSSDGQKTFKSVFLAAFRVTFTIFSGLLIIAALVLLAIFLYLAYGIWALIGAIIGIILVLLLLTFLFNKAFDFVFHER